MGNCNCFKISQQQNSLKNKDFLIDGDENGENNQNTNQSNNQMNPYNSDNNTTGGIHQKFSPRGVSNPTQKQNNKKNFAVNNRKRESENFVSDTINNINKEKNNIQNQQNKKTTNEKLEDTSDKDNNFDTYNSLYNKNSGTNKQNPGNDITQLSAIEKNTNNNINVNNNIANVNNKNTLLLNNGRNDKHNSSQSLLNTRLTEILKLKDLTKNLKDKSNSINIILLGDKCVGKTSIVYQYISNKFDQYYIQTIIKEEFTKVVSVNNKKYTVNFIVTSGVPQYQEDYTNSYKISDFFVVCYDITNKSSYEKAKEIISKEILPYVFLYNDGYANIVLLGNKCDSKERKVDSQVVAEYCKKYNIDFYEVSAKQKTNIAKVFHKIVDVYDEALALLSKE